MPRIAFLEAAGILWHSAVKLFFLDGGSHQHNAMKIIPCYNIGRPKIVCRYSVGMSYGVAVTRGQRGSELVTRFNTRDGGRPTATDGSAGLRIHQVTKHLKTWLRY